ncbi:thiosulfate:glutathione sulfurtransferase [Molossus nigricans]
MACRSTGLHPCRLRSPPTMAAATCGSPGAVSCLPRGPWSVWGPQKGVWLRKGEKGREGGLTAVHMPPSKVRDGGLCAGWGVPGVSHAGRSVHIPSAVPTISLREPLSPGLGPWAPCGREISGRGGRGTIPGVLNMLVSQLESALQVGPAAFQASYSLRPKLEDENLIVFCQMGKWGLQATRLVWDTEGLATPQGPIEKGSRKEVR